MLAVNNPPLNDTAPPLSSDFLSRRGRSRQVSKSALARQASEERRAASAPSLPVAVPFLPTERTSQMSLSPSSSSRLTLDKVITVASPVPVPVPVNASFSTSFSRSTSPSPPSSASMSPEQPESPPPPLSLEDQVHEAYALEDIHLAKILLLRLKGIEVTSDDDPRIAAVQDEDFDYCFLPNGPLLSEQDELALKELQAREMERFERAKRAERMRVCERKWIEQKQRLRDRRIADFRRRERKRQEEEHRLHRSKEEGLWKFSEDEQRSLSHPTLTKARDRKFVNYECLANKFPSSNLEQQFVYDYIMTGSSCHRQPPTSASQSTSRFPTLTFDESRTIPFKDVLTSMKGQLFPVTDDERMQRNPSPQSRSRTSSRRRDIQLLDVLLTEVEDAEEDHRKRNTEGQQRSYTQRSSVCLACSACRSPLPSPSSTFSSSSSVSRTSSWLSFRTSSSLSSSNTDLTMPSSSPMASRKSSWLASRPQSWIPVPTVTDMLSSPKPPLRHSCRAYNRLSPIPLSEAPLLFELPTTSPKSLPLSHEGRQRSSGRFKATKEGTGLLVKHVSRIVELAKNLQSAYVAAALFSVTVSYEDGDVNHAFFRRKQSAVNSADRRAPGAPGSRASANDVKTFLTVSVRSEEDSECSPAPRYIPLVSPYPPTEQPRTILPDPLPYQLHFKPMPQTIRSPFHHHAHAEMHTTYPSPSDQIPFGQLSWRIRCVGNPAYLRLKAVQNVVWRNGVKWEGCGRDSAMGGGRERVIGIAYEGARRSNLSCAISMSD